MEETIFNSVSSVLNQKGKVDFEVIVVDDGSSDRTSSILENIVDFRLKTYRQSNKGVAAARNIGMSLARGEFIAFLDGDDVWSPYFLEEFLKVLKKYPATNIYCCGYQIGSSLKLRKKEQKIWLIFNLYKDLLRYRIKPSMGNIVFRKAPISSLEFDESLKIGEDELFIYKAIINEKMIVFNNEILQKISENGNSNWRSVDNMMLPWHLWYSYQTRMGIDSVYFLSKLRRYKSFNIREFILVSRLVFKSNPLFFLLEFKLILKYLCKRVYYYYTTI